MTHYRIAEFAKLGGVTVRTLHYYDRIGLLKPSASTDGGHRRYTAADLLRLQQIMTLKWMHFSLEQIGVILASPTYDLKQALSAQRAAIEEQIERLQAAAEALQTALEAAAAQETETLPAETIQAILRGVSHQGAFMDRYFSETEQAGIALRAMAYSPQQFEQAQRRWQALYDEFAARMHQPLDDPQVQRLAAEMDALIAGFTGGDANTEAAMQQLVTDARAGKLPDMPEAEAHFAAVDPDLQRFMEGALQHYRQTNKRRP